MRKAAWRPDFKTTAHSLSGTQDRQSHLQKKKKKKKKKKLSPISRKKKKSVWIVTQGKIACPATHAQVKEFASLPK